LGRRRNRLRVAERKIWHYKRKEKIITSQIFLAVTTVTWHLQLRWMGTSPLARSADAMLRLVLALTRKRVMEAPSVLTDAPTPPTFPPRASTTRNTSLKECPRVEKLERNHYLLTILQVLILGYARVNRSLIFLPPPSAIAGAPIGHFFSFVSFIWADWMRGGQKILCRRHHPPSWKIKEK